MRREVRTFIAAALGVKHNMGRTADRTNNQLPRIVIAPTPTNDMYVILNLIAPTDVLAKALGDPQGAFEDYGAEFRFLIELARAYAFQPWLRASGSPVQVDNEDSPVSTKRTPATPDEMVGRGTKETRGRDLMDVVNRRMSLLR